MSSSASLSRRVTVFLRDHFACRYCGRSALKGELSILDLSLDHIAPQSVGGTDQAGNLVTCCKTCNYLKGGTIFKSIDDAIQFVQAQRMLREKQFLRSFLATVDHQDHVDIFTLFSLTENQEVTAK